MHSLMWITKGKECNGIKLLSTENSIVKDCAKWHYMPVLSGTMP